MVEYGKSLPDDERSNDFKGRFEDEKAHVGFVDLLLSNSFLVLLDRIFASSGSCRCQCVVFLCFC